VRFEKEGRGRSRWIGGVGGGFGECTVVDPSRRVLA